MLEAHICEHLLECRPWWLLSLSRPGKLQMGTGLMLRVYRTASPKRGDNVMVHVNPSGALGRSLDPCFSLQEGHVVLTSSRTKCCLPSLVHA